MKKLVYFLGSVCFLMLWSGCRKDFEFSPNTGQLEFSKDTIYLDTVFTNIGSSTYNLKVYNRSNEDIYIPTVRLGLGETSNYRLNIDGIPGKEFQNIQLLAKDSMYIFVETTIDINNFANPDGTYLYTDQIQFDTGSNQQNVELITLVQDAVFIYPDQDNTTGLIETLTLNLGGEIIETEIQGRYLELDELNFTNEKPYVIYGYAAVPNGEILTVEAGARVHFHANSGLLVAEGASLKVNGTISSDPELLENEVIFEGDRLEPLFSDIPGQWGTIWLFDGSVNNTLNYATIKNATVGILSDGNPNEATAKLTITNSQLYNHSNFGILGRNTSITGENLVFNNSGQSSFAGTFGGRYNLTHCTIGNYWSNSFRQFPALLINNFMLDETNTAYLADLTEANFTNCIIYGNDPIEFMMDEIQDTAVAFNFKFTNCLIRFDSGSTDFGGNYNFNNTEHYVGNAFNLLPDFREPYENDMMIGEESAANSLALPLIPIGNDIIGTPRGDLNNEPDSGAYESIPFE